MQNFSLLNVVKNMKGMKDAPMNFRLEVFQWPSAEMKPVVLQKPPRKILLQYEALISSNTSVLSQVTYPNLRNVTDTQLYCASPIPSSAPPKET